MYGQFGYILYLLVQNKVRFNTVSGYDQQFFWVGGWGWGGEHFIFYTVLSIVDFFFKLRLQSQIHRVPYG